MPVCVYILPAICLVKRVFDNGLGYRGSIPDRVKKLILSIRCVSRVKWSNPGKRGAPSPTPQYTSYWTGSLWVVLNYGRQFHKLYVYIYTCVYVYMYIYIYIHVCVYIYRHVYAYIYICTYVYVYLYVCMHICICILYIYIYTYIRVYVYIYVYI